MASTYSNLKIELIGSGEQDTTWGDTNNVNLGVAIEEAIAGRATVTFPTDADLTISLTNTNTTQAARNHVLNVTSAVPLTAVRTLFVPTITKSYIIENNTTGGFNIVVRTAAGTGITVPNGLRTIVYGNGVSIISPITYIPQLELGSLTSSISAVTFVQLTVSGAASVGGVFTASGASTHVGTATFSNATTPIITARLGPAVGQQHVLPTVASDTIALLTAPQTITSKQLTGNTISGGTINNTPVGATTRNSGAFTTLTANSLDTTPIGAITPSTGAFTTLTNSGAATLGPLVATSLNSTPIGATTPSTGVFSTLSATTLTVGSAPVLGYTLAPVQPASGAQVLFTGIPAGVNRVTVLIDGVSTTGNDNVQMQIGISSGLKTTDYFGAAQTSGVNTTSFTTAFLITSSNNASFPIHGSLTLSRVTANVWAMSGITSRNGSNTVNTTAGTVTLSGALDRVAVNIDGASTFDAGQISISYE